MRKSKYDTMPLTPQNTDNDSGNGRINAIENRIEHSAEIVTLMEQTKTLKQLIAELQKIQSYADRSMEEYRKSIKAFNAAVQSSDNIVDSICRSVVRAEKAVITVSLSKEERDELANHRQKLVEEEKNLLEAQMTELKNLQESHWREMRKFLKAESGFYLTGRFAKFAFISFWLLYAYLCLTLGWWIIMD